MRRSLPPGGIERVLCVLFLCALAALWVATSATAKVVLPEIKDVHPCSGTIIDRGLSISVNMCGSLASGRGETVILRRDR